MSDSTPEFILEPIPLGDLRLDARYQRDLREAVVLAIADNYRPEQFQPLTVGMRPDNTLHIVDGQHRFAAARRMGWETVPCMVFLSEGYEHEAAVFERLQTARAPLTVGQRWKARIARKEPKATAINDIVQSLGLRLQDGGRVAPTTFHAFTACEAAYERGNLKETLVLIIQAWDYDPTGFRADFVGWVSLFLSAMNAEHFNPDMHRVVDALKKVRPAQFLRDAPLSGNATAAFTARLLAEYNKGLRAEKKIEILDPVALLASVAGKRAHVKATESGNATGLAKAQEKLAAMTPAQRSEMAKKAAMALTPEQRRERAAKGFATRAARRNASAPLESLV